MSGWKIDPHKSEKGIQPYGPGLFPEPFDECDELQHQLHFLPVNYIRCFYTSYKQFCFYQRQKFC